MMSVNELLYAATFSFLLTLISIFTAFIVFTCVTTIAALLGFTATPPGPFPWPVVGNLLQIGRNPHIKLTSMARIYGPIMSLRFGSRLVVVGSSAKVAVEILKTHDSVLSGRHLSNTHPASCPKINQFAVGFAKECNEQWRFMRSICRDGLFSARAIEFQAKNREKNVLNMVNYLHEVEGKLVNVSEVVLNVVLNTMCNILFSRDLFGLGPDVWVAGADFKGLSGKFLNSLAATNVADLFPMMHGFDIQGLQKNVRKIQDKMFALWEHILKERRENRGNGIRAQQDFLDSLIDIGLTDDHINHLLLELLLAGTDTTVTVIIWAFSDLIKNMLAMSKLRDELAGITQIIGESTAMNLAYLQACVRESMRLHPPIPFLLPHRSIKSCKLMNYRIPEGTEVIINTWAVARDPSIWDDPSSFKPERFLNSGLDYKGQDFEYVPFGSGRRMCPGMPMATRIVSYVVASLIQTFNWSLPGNRDLSELDMDEEYCLALRKKEPLQLIPGPVSKKMV